MSLAISERDWQTRVVDCARLFGWRYCHQRPARTKRGWVTPYSGAGGFPDLVLLRGGRLILAELKSDRGVATADQQEWLAGFGEVPGVESYVWRPEDWTEVYQCLAKDSRP